MQPCWITLYQRKAEKGWLAAYSTTLYTTIHDMAASDIVYDITASDTDCWAQKGTSHSQISPQLSNTDLIGPDTEWKSAVSIFFVSQIIMLFAPLPL